jgi:hypothetical protein
VLTRIRHDLEPRQKKQIFYSGEGSCCRPEYDTISSLDKKKLFFIPGRGLGPTRIQHDLEPRQKKLIFYSGEGAWADQNTTRSRA